MEHGANQYINNQRQRANNDLFTGLLDEIDKIGGGLVNTNLRKLVNSSREIEVSGNYQLARIEDLKQRTQCFTGGKMTIIENFELINSYYSFLREVEERARFDFRVGNLSEEKPSKNSFDMLKLHVKRIGPRKRINVGLDPYTGRFDYVLEYDGEPNIKMFEDCIVQHFTVPGIDLYESTKKLLVECQKCGCTRQQLAEIVYTLVAKEMPILASSIRRRSENPTYMLESLYDLYTQDETLNKIESALEREKRAEKQDIAIFGARIKELLIHKYQLTQPGMDESKMLERANRITKSYCLDVVTDEVKEQVLKVIQKRNREGREMDFAEFIACIQTMEDMEGSKYKPKTTLRVKQGVGEERTALYNGGLAVGPSSKDSRDLEDLTLDQPKKKDYKKRESRKKEKKKFDKPKGKRTNEGRPNRSSSGRSTSAYSSATSRGTSASSRNASNSRGRSSSKNSAKSRSSSRGSQTSRFSSRSSSRGRSASEKESHFNTDSRRRSNKPNKENYNRDRSDQRKSSDRNSKAAKSSKTPKSSKPSGSKNQKLCVTCASVNKCPPGKCLQYPKDVEVNKECPRCKRGCHAAESCSMTKN